MKVLATLAVLIASTLMVTGCLDNSVRSYLASYCPGAEKAIAFYGDWDDLVPAAYRNDVTKAVATSNYVCANRATITARQAFDAAADLYRSLEVARRYAPNASAWVSVDKDRVAQFDSIMSRAREAGLK